MRNAHFLRALAVGGWVVLTYACNTTASHDDGGHVAGTGGTSGIAGGGSGGQAATGGMPGVGGGPGLGGSASDAAGTAGGGSGGQSSTGGMLGSGGGPGLGGSASDAAGTTGGGSGGQPATGGVPGSGGGDGGMDAAVICTDDGGTGLPAVARRCSVDSDCTIAIAARCCGPDQALGEAKSAAVAYAACLALPPGACAGLGCAKFAGYVTDTGRTTPVGAATEKPIDWVVVHCQSGLCTSDVAQQSCDGACQPDAGSACSSSCAGGTPCPDRCSAACAQGKICCPWSGGACIPNDAGGCSGAQGYNCATPTATGTCPNQCYP